MALRGARRRQLDVRLEVAVDELPRRFAQEVVREAELDRADLVQPSERLGRQLDVEAADNVVQLLDGADADDRDDPVSTCSHPGDRHLGRCRTQAVGDAVHLAGDA